MQNLLDALTLGSLYAMVGLGIGLVFGIMRLANFSYGDLITFGAYALIVPFIDYPAVPLFAGWPWYLLLPTVAAMVVGLSLLTDVLVFSKLRNATPTTMMIASLGVGYVIHYSIIAVYGAQPKGLDLWPSLQTQIEFQGLRIPVVQLVTIAVTAILLVAFTLFLQRTSFGIQMRAAAEDLRMARYLGVRTNFVIRLAFVLAGLLSAVVSLLLVSQTGGLNHTLGAPLMLFGFIATVIGGMGNLLGAVVGGYLVGFIPAMLQTYLPNDLRPFRDAFVYAIVILILIFRPSGLLSSKATNQRV